MSIVCDLMGHCSAQWRVKINSVCLSRTRFVIGGNFRQYIRIAGLQLSIPWVIDLSIYRLSSVDVRVASIVNHLSIYQFIFILHCHVYVGDWSTVAACWHRTCLVLRWGVVTLLLQSVTPADTFHRALLLARGCLWRLASSVTRLCHHRRAVWLLSRFLFVDKCPVATVLLVRPVLLATI